jgi:hypothetical protein
LNYKRVFYLLFCVTNIENFLTTTKYYYYFFYSFFKKYIPQHNNHYTILLYYSPLLLTTYYLKLCLINQGKDTRPCVRAYVCGRVRVRVCASAWAGGWACGRARDGSGSCSEEAGRSRWAVGAGGSCDGGKFMERRGGGDGNRVQSGRATRHERASECERAQRTDRGKQGAGGGPVSHLFFRAGKNFGLSFWILAGLFLP